MRLVRWRNSSLSRRGDEPGVQFFVVADGAGRAERHQIARLLEFPVIGPEGDRQSEGRRFERVVDADAESAAHIAPCRIAVDRGEQAHGVEDHHLLRPESRVGRALRVTQRPAPRLGDQPRDAALVHFVGGDDELDFGIVVRKADEQLLVRAPSRTGHEETCVALEAVDEVDASGGPGDFGHTVETGVSGHQHVVESQRRQQFFRLLVLHEQDVERFERLPPHAAVGTEEDRIAAEDGRNDEGPHMPAAQFREQVQPELVFDEDGDFGVYGVEKPAGVTRGVDRQVEDMVGSGVVFPDFVARRREEGEQDFVFGVFPAQLLDDRAALFELAERRDVHPDDLLPGSDRFAYAAEEVPASFDPEPGLRMARRHEPDGPYIECQPEIIEPHRCLPVLRFVVSARTFPALGVQCQGVCFQPAKIA